VTRGNRILLSGLSPAQALDLHRHLSKHGGSEIRATQPDRSALGALGSEAALILEVSAPTIRDLWDWAQQQPGDHFSYTAEVQEPDGGVTVHEIRIEKGIQPSNEAINEIMRQLSQRGES
jgi:hypothetical protein